MQIRIVCKLRPSHRHVVLPGHAKSALWTMVLNDHDGLPADGQTAAPDPPSTAHPSRDHTGTTCVAPHSSPAGGPQAHHAAKRPAGPGGPPAKRLKRLTRCSHSARLATSTHPLLAQCVQLLKKESRSYQKLLADEAAGRAGHAQGLCTADEFLATHPEWGAVWWMLHQHGDDIVFPLWPRKLKGLAFFHYANGNVSSIGQLSALQTSSIWSQTMQLLFGVVNGCDEVRQTGSVLGCGIGVLDYWPLKQQSVEDPMLHIDTTYDASLGE
jgi:hypothetical protein